MGFTYQNPENKPKLKNGNGFSGESKRIEEFHGVQYMYIYNKEFCNQITSKTTNRVTSKEMEFIL